MTLSSLSLPSVLAGTFEADPAVLSITVDLTYFDPFGSLAFHFAVVTPSESFGPFESEAEATEFAEGLSS
jgi:hypothetical protein